MPPSKRRSSGACAGSASHRRWRGGRCARSVLIVSGGRDACGSGDWSRPDDMALVDLVRDVADEHRRGDAAPHDGLENVPVEWLVEAEDAEDHADLEEGERHGVAADHPLAVLRELPPEGEVE